MAFSFNPWQWVRNVWQRDDSVASTSEPDDDGRDKTPIAQPFFLCPSCGYSRETTPDGRNFCQQCAKEFSRQDLAVLTQARDWLNNKTRTLALKELMALADDRDAIRRMMREFYDGLLTVDRKSLKFELDSAGFPGSNTFEMLIHWVDKRLKDRVKRETLTAMYGPPVYVVRGGLPGLGK
jgi:hypothetical protein